jgi:hypothetical protein
MSRISRRLVLQLVTVIVTAGLGPVTAIADDLVPPSGRRVALRGYDPVSYFTDGRPAEGTREFWFAFDDAIYLFRSAKHREMFASAPDRYAPQYAGYCAGGMAFGSKVEADPTVWTISDDRLFVFFAKEDVPDFVKDPAGVMSKADANWKTLHGRN